MSDKSPNLLRLDQLKAHPSVDKLIIHSLDLCLYQASAWIHEQEYFLVDATGRHVRTHSLAEMVALLEGVEATEFCLHQQSAYDEMLGQPVRQQANLMEVPLAKTLIQPIPTPGSRAIQ
jgi:hypothetical protein